MRPPTPSTNAPTPVSDYTFYWNIVLDKWPQLLQGAALTVEATLVSMLSGTLLAVPLALWRRQESGIGYRCATLWVEVSRNTPALFQVYMAYFGLGAAGVDVPSFAALLLAITFNNAGYLAEIFRGGLACVPPTQFAAARSLGMSAPRAYVHVVFPQVFVLIALPYVNQLNWALLNTSLGSIIGVRELTGATQAAQSESFRTFEFFIAAALIYYAISKAAALGARLAVWRFADKG